MEADLNRTTAFFTAERAVFASNYDGAPTFRDRLDLFIRSLQRTTPLPARVLDFGCGPGVIAVAVARLGYEVLGLDGSSGMIDIARTRAEGLKAVRFEPADSTCFDPAAVGFFDAVICSSVIEYIPEDVGLLKKLISSVRPGGHLLISVPHSAHVFARLEPIAHQIKLRLKSRSLRHLTHSIHRYGRKSFLGRLSDLGLDELRCTSFECPVFGNFGVKLSRFSFFGRMLLFEGRKRKS